MEKKIRAGGLALCLLAGAAFAADRLFWCEPYTGFVRVGPAALRWGGWLVLGALCLLPGRRAAPCPAALQQPCRPLGGCLAAAAAALLAAGAAALPQMAAGTAVLPQASARVVGVLNVLLPLLAAAGLLLLARRALAGPMHGAVPSAVLALGLLLWVFWVLLYRFEIQPAAVARLSCTVRVVSACAAVVFALALCKTLLAPGTPCGGQLAGSGLAAFLFCFCMELPGSFIEQWAGGLSAAEQCTSLGLGALGLCGAVCFWQAFGPDGWHAPEPTH